MSRHVLNLLVLDDDPAIVRLVAAVLRRQFCEELTVHALADPVDARDWLDENCCDILISDIEMPQLDGLDILRFAKQRNPWTQVIFITGHSTIDRISAAIENGATDYLVKPIDDGELIAVVSEQLVRIRRWLTAVHGTLHAKSSV